MAASMCCVCARAFSTHLCNDWSCAAKDDTLASLCALTPSACACPAIASDRRCKRSRLVVSMSLQYSAVLDTASGRTDASAASRGLGLAARRSTPGRSTRLSTWPCLLGTAKTSALYLVEASFFLGLGQLRLEAEELKVLLVKLLLLLRRHAASTHGGQG